MHLKEIFTEKFLFTGTSNFTFSGLNSNFETNWFFEDEGILVQERIEDFNKLINRQDIKQVELNNFEGVPKKEAEAAETKF